MNTSPPPVPQPAPAPEPMPDSPSIMNVIENLLKQPVRLMQACKSGKGGVPAKLICIAAVSLSVFGVLLGTFSGGEQLWAAPLKIVLGMVVAVLICTPSLYIFSALDGLNGRLSQIMAVLLGMVALLALLMLGFAPIIWVFSTSTDSIGFMGFLVLVFWIIGLYFGSRLLVSTATSLGLQTTGYLRIWIVIFTVVTLQMSTTLRPLIGTSPDLLPTEKRFFLQHWLEQFNDENQAVRQK